MIQVITLTNYTIKGLLTNNNKVVQQADVLSDKVVSEILLMYPEDNKALMLKTFFTIGLFAAFRVDYPI